MAAKKTNGKSKKELSEKERAALDKKRDNLYAVKTALEEDLPQEICEALETLEDKDKVKELKVVLKNGGMDGGPVLQAIDVLVKAWKVLSKDMDKAMKAADKDIAALTKQLGDRDSGPNSFSY